MPYRDRMIVMAGLTMVIGAAPALAHGGGSHGHGHSSVSAARTGASTKFSAPAATQVAPGARSTPAPMARMVVTTALGAPAMTTKVSTSSAVADPPSAPATAASTSPSTQSSGGGGGSRTDLSQFNTGAQDLATPGVSPRQPPTSRIWRFPRRAGCSAQTSRPPHFSRQDHRSRQDQRSSTSMARSCRTPPPAVRWHRRPPLLR
jgi:hypothetical protein